MQFLFVQVRISGDGWHKNGGLTSLTLTCEKWNTFTRTVYRDVNIFERLNNSTLISKHYLFLHSYVFSTGMEELSNGVMKADECAIPRPLSIKESKGCAKTYTKDLKS